MMQIPVSLIAQALDGAILRGRCNLLVKRIVADSRIVRTGDMFACVRGKTVDGHRFISNAIERGAVAVLLERPVQNIETDKICIIKVTDVEKTLKMLTPLFYNYPSQHLNVIGVTGTNGKTSITLMLKEIWNAQGTGRKLQNRVGLMGTIQHEVAGEIIPSVNTTPMVWDVQLLLADMVHKKCNLAVLEVSSHALMEERIQSCEFDTAIYTNLTREHLDFHGTMEHYAAAKRRLFSKLVESSYKGNEKVAVVNVDDTFGSRMAKAAHGAKVITYALEQPADYGATDIHMNSKSTIFKLNTPKDNAVIQLKLVGRHNVLNALAAAAAMHARGVSLIAIKKGLERIKVIPGRLESITSGQRFNVFVDYAHTPDALKQVLKTIREFTTKQVIVVFGCGGERDKTKRGLMGSIALEMADKIVITSDNPRSEEPERIIKEIIDGLPKELKKLKEESKSLFVEILREQAIEKAIKFAKSGDTILIAGKGHETYQVLKDRTIAFDDRKVARRYLTRRVK